MRRAEPLQIDGVISRRLLESLTLAQEILSSWNPTMRRVAVRAAAVDESPAAGGRARVLLLARHRLDLVRRRSTAHPGTSSPA